MESAHVPLCEIIKRKTLQNSTGIVNYQWYHNIDHIRGIFDRIICNTGICIGKNIASDRRTWDWFKYHWSSMALQCIGTIFLYYGSFHFI